MAVQLGSLIWTAVRALLKFILTALCGYILARRGLLDSHGSRALSQAVMNIFLPALIFSKIVLGIDNSLGKEVGIIALTSILHMAMGLVFGYMTRFTTRCPRGWENGLLAAGCFSNTGDLPIVLLGTITQAPPFSGQSASDKSVAYISIYIFMQTIVFFNLGTAMVQRDFAKAIPDEEACPEGVGSAKHKGLGHLLKASHRIFGRRLTHAPVTMPVTYLAPPLATIAQEKRLPKSRQASAGPLSPGEALGLARSGSIDSLRLQPVTSGMLNHGDLHAHLDPQQITREPSKRRTEESTLRTQPSSSDLSTTAAEEQSFWQRSRPLLTTIMWRFLSPPSAATLLAFLIAMITPLKQLFTHLPASESNLRMIVDIPNAPDGQPPLAFITDTTNFIGGATVPSSLLILGYALSRLRIRRGERIPALSSAVVLGLLKLVVGPIIAIAWMQFLARTLINPTDLVLRLVLVLPAATPTATSLMYVTQIFATEGRESETQSLGVVLLLQYALLGITLTITVVYTLNLIS
jgi:predicted permease